MLYKLRNLKFILSLICVWCIVFTFSACKINGGGNGGGDDDDDDTTATTISFQNNERYEVGLSSSPGIEPLWRVKANSTSDKIEYSAGTGNFYLTYYISIDEVVIPYSPSGGKGFITKEISANTDTLFVIPALKETHNSSEKEAFLSEKAYFKINNTSNLTLSLTQGSTTLHTIENAASISGESSGIYELAAGSTAMYSLVWNVTENVILPFSNFEAGCFYSYKFSGGNTISMERQIFRLTLENLVADTPAPHAPDLLAGDTMITVRWNSQPNALSYKVYGGTTDNPTTQIDSVNTTVSVITGLSNKRPYYVRIKAVYANGESDFSETASATPWPADEAPEEAPSNISIIQGDGYLSISWDKADGATEYELYIADTTSIPQTPRRTLSGTQATITDLQNGTVYYIWIKSLNTNGASDYSEIKAGMPSLPAVAPDAPSAANLVAGNKKIYASWTAVTGASSYELWYNTEDTTTGATQLPIIDASAELSATISGLTNNTVYYVWVRARNNIGASPYSLSASCTPSAFTEIPASPGAPALVAGNGKLSASWDDVEGALSYELWYGTSSNSASALQYGDDISGTSAEIRGLTNNTTYYVWLKAKNNLGASDFGPSASGMPVFVPTTAPEAVSGLFLRIGNSEITALWDTNEDATAYEVFTGTTNNSGEASKYGEDVTDTTITISSLTNGTTYYVWIKAKNTIGSSDFGTAASAKPIGDMGTVLVASGNGSLSASWDAVAGADTYNVYYSTNTTQPDVASDTVNTTSAVISGLTNGSTYYVWVKPVNSYGAGTVSSMVSGMPSLSAVPPASSPTPVLNAIANGSLSFTWDAIAGASSYEVWYGTLSASDRATKYGDDITGTSTTISGLTNGTVYDVWIKAKNNSGTASFGSSASGRPIGTIGTVTVTAGNGSLDVSWGAVAGADAYDVYYSTSTIQPGTASQNVSTTSTTINSLTNGTTYYVWVKPVNSYGAGEVSNRVSGTPSIYAVPPASSPTPVLSAIANANLSFTWAAIAGASSYEVWYGTSSESGSATKYGSDVTGTSTTISGLTNGTVYYVWLKAKNNSGIAPFGSSVSGRPIGTIGTVTVTPGNGSLDVSWDAVTGADAYDVYYSTSTTQPGTASQNVSATSTTINSLTNGTTYYVWVRPVNSYGAGAVSSRVSGMPSIIGDINLTAGKEKITLDISLLPAGTYQYYYSTNNTLSGSPSGNSISETSAVISGLTSNATYYIWIRSRSGIVWNAWEGPLNCRVLNNNTALASISAQGISTTLSPALSTSVSAHTLTIPAATNSITLAVSVSDTNATVDKPTQTVTVTGASTNATVTVTAEDGTEKVYTITVAHPGSVSGITITIDISDETISGFPALAPSLSKGDSDTLPITIDDTDYTSVAWYVDGSLSGSTDSLTLDANSYAIGGHYLSVEVLKDGVYYSDGIGFTVTE
jgi:hypothetical protein